MRYPSKYVLTTDLDDDNYETKCKMVPPMPISEKSINDLGNPVTMHAAVTASNVLPERIWQDCIANPLELTASALLSSQLAAFNSGSAASPAALSPTIKEEPTTSTVTSAQNNNDANPWEFVDPTQKSTCSCTKWVSDCISM